MSNLTPNITLNLTQTAIRLYSQLFGSPERAGLLDDGLETVLDGNTAIAVTEACISEVAVLSSSFLTQGAALAWLSEQQRVSNNFFDQPLSIQHADSSRGVLASAMGVTQTGHRSSVFLTAQDLSACQDLLRIAVGRHLPLVIHLDNQLSAAHATTNGSGHDTLHQIMDSGCVLLFATNVQEAADFTLIARHVAEISLTPVVVVMDGAETALSAQDVRLPSAELVKQFIGRSDELFKTPSIAQKQIFSEHRRRIPKWHNLDKPVLQGALQNAKLFALGHAAADTYFAELVPGTLEQAFVQYRQLTARQYSSLSIFNPQKAKLKKADIIIIAQGSVLETLNTFSRYLSSLKKNNSAGLQKINLGIIGLHSVRPFPAKALTELLSPSTAKQIIVLERMSTPLATNSPLMREIRACLQEHQVAGQPFSANLRSVIYGLGGSELSFADLYSLCESAKNNTLQGKYLGIPFISYNIKNAKSKTKETHPKRQVMLDTLERYYPQISELAITNTQGHDFDLSSIETHSVSYAISYISDSATTLSYAMDLSAYLYSLKHTFIRSSVDSSWQQWSQRHTDYITQAETPYDDSPYASSHSSQVNFFLLFDMDSQALLNACQKLTTKGILIFSGFGSDNASVQDINDSLQLIKDKSLTLYEVENKSNELIWEEMLATLIAIQLKQQQISLKTRKIISLRESMQAGDSLVKQDYFRDIFSAIVENNQPYPAEQKLEQKLKQLSRTLPEQAKNSLDIPEMVKNLGKNTDNYDSLPRFWDQIGILQQNGESDQLTADPYLATGTMPSLSAVFNDMGQYRKGKALPVFDAKSCTACGACWLNCPESAIATVAINPKALIETGIRMAGADGLRAVSAKLAAHIARRCRNNDLDISNSGELLQDGFAQFKEKSSMPEERMQSIEADFNKAHNALAELPIVLSDTLFYQQESKQNESGELLALVINPNSCKACDLCIELCAEQAENTDQHAALSHYHLQEGEGDEQEGEQESVEDIVQGYKRQWSIWQKTPDTPSATIERLLQEHDQQNSLAAGSVLMLSRHNAFSLSGGDQAELASGEKIALRQLLSGVEYHQQPLVYQFMSELERLRDALKAEINSSLAEALPTDNLTLLAEKLSDVKTRQVDLNTLLRHDETIMDNNSIDALKTQQWVQLVLQLNELHWKLSEGVYGFGRARYSLCITSAETASWAGAFPYNPFHVPVHIDASGESVQVAMGLMQGQIKELLLAVSLLRQAKASVDARYAKQTEKLTHLEWQDLTAEEQQLCPPLFLVGGDDLLGSHGFSQIALLLNSDYPLKVIIFNELDSGLATNQAQQADVNPRQDSANNLAMMAMSQQNAYVAQVSIADNDHFQQSVQQLLSNNNAGLLSIYTPSPQRHGFAPEHTIKQAKLALYSNMFPLFQYNPQDKGVFGSRLTLHEVAAQQDSRVNPVHWAINEQRFQRHFSDLTSNAIQPLELSDWLQLDTIARTKKTPFMVLNNDNNEIKIAISHEFALMIAEQQTIQRTLQELAGIVTPFTDYVEQCVAERLSAEHQAELDALRVEYEAKIKQLEENYSSQTHTKIRNQLLDLAGYDSGLLN